jgi:hypothetical protein
MPLQLKAIFDKWYYLAFIPMALSLSMVLFAPTMDPRCGEILDLEWKHVDLEKNSYSSEKQKNDRPRSIALSDPLIHEKNSSRKNP